MRRNPVIYLVITAILAAALSAAAQAPGSVVCIPEDTHVLPMPKTPWHKAILRRGYSTLDTNVSYPRFLRFCIGVYNWGDKTFNGYNPDYVEGTGKKWKAMLKLDNWTDSYAMRFSKGVPINMISDAYSDIGITVAYMALSLSYSVNLTNVIGKQIIARNRFEAQFTCSRFAASFYYWDNNGGTVIRRLGDYHDGRPIRENFKGLSLHAMGGDVFYILNNRKYAQAAAYSFSKIQKRSAGSFMFGLSVSRQDVDINFSHLDDELKPYLKSDRMRYTFDYNDYSLIIGYGYNAVMGRHWLFNISAIPSVGWKHSRATSIEGKRDFFAVNAKGKLGFVYNLQNMFVAINANFDGHWYKNGPYSFFNSMQNVALMTGLRF